jgi:ABC-type ATPase involved in cell division/GNAT superfamily N-acetyltransferase
MRIRATVKSPVYTGYRAARVRSMFNVTESDGASHTVDVDLPIEGTDWKIGLVVGPSGTGKTTIGRELLGGGKLHQGFEWDPEKPIIEQIGAGQDFTAVTGALSAVGLGTVPSWLRPFHVLSMGERFRAEMARIVIEEPEAIVVDEFTSVVDRQIAQIGASAFAKAWRRTKGQIILLSCHYDIIEWLTPDWVLDTKYWRFARGCLQRRPNIDLDIYETSSPAAWKFFKPHHYLDLPNPVCATYYIAEHKGEPVAHLAVSPGSGLKYARLTRLVVMPEWQGAGVGMKFLEYVARRWFNGENRYGKRMTTIIHTSHPGLVAALNRGKRWVLTSQQMGGGDKQGFMKRVAAAAAKNGKASIGGGLGGHLRAVSGFRFVGDRP